MHDLDMKGNLDFEQGIWDLGIWDVGTLDSQLKNPGSVSYHQRLYEDHCLLGSMGHPVGPQAGAG